MTLQVTIDFETRSEVDLRKVGAWNYAAHPSTEILCLGYQVGTKPPAIWKPNFKHGNDRNMPIELAAAFWSCHGIVYAHNMFFERCIWHHICHKQYQWYDLSWNVNLRCSAAQAAALALPRKLEDVADVVGLSEKKDMDGHRVMMKLTKPKRPSKRCPHKFNHDPADFERNETYCLQDVRTEHKLVKTLPPLSPAENRIWQYDQQINLRGIQADVVTAKKAIDVITELTAEAETELYELTEGQVETIGQVGEIKKWANRRGAEMEGVGKEAIAEALERITNRKVRRVLEIRRDYGRSSVKKFQALLDRVGTDGRLRETVLYHGASTGRWTGLGFQPQNLFKGKLSMADIENVIDLINQKDIDSLKMLYAPPMTTIASILRSMLIAAPGKQLIAADYNAIETRVGAWIAGEPKLMKAFRRGQSPYLQLARVLYGRKIDKHKDPAEYLVGKSGILGSQYQCGPDKFSTQFNVEFKLAKKVVKSYRKTYTEIVKYWAKCETAALEAVAQRGRIRCGKVTFSRERGWLFCELPSGRRLAYFKPRIRERIFYLYKDFVDGEERTRMKKKLIPGKKPDNIITKPGLTFEGIDEKKKWRRLDTYGGKLFENIVQAVSRDILAGAIPKLELSDFPIVLTVHDEIVSETEPDKTLEEMIKIMCARPSWAADLPIAAEGWQGQRYRKD